MVCGDVMGAGPRMAPAGADEFAAEMQARADISALPAVRQAHEGFDHHIGQF
jgi:hypothetical protein